MSRAKLVRYAWIGVAAVWAFKIAEIGARQTKLIPGNLGWGYVVDLSIPLAITLAFGVLLAALKLRSR